MMIQRSAAIILVFSLIVLTVPPLPRAGAQGRPELVIIDQHSPYVPAIRIVPEMGKNNVGPGSTVSVIALVTNTQNVPAANVSVLIYTVFPASLERVDLGTVVLDVVGGSASVEAAVPWKPTVPGTYRVFAEVDPDDQILEVDDTNNDAWIEVVVPPNLNPIIQDFEPGEGVVPTIDEAGSQEFWIKALDPEFQATAAGSAPNPDLRYTWYTYQGPNFTLADPDPEPNASTDHFVFRADYTGRHSSVNGSLHHVVVRVDDPAGGSAMHQWDLVVTNINLPFTVVSAEPTVPLTIDEESTATFSILAEDPDPEDQTDGLTYAWYLSTSEEAVYEETSTSGSTYVFRANASSSAYSPLTVRVRIEDRQGAQAWHEWELVVTNVNIPPEIRGADPSTEGEVAAEEGSPLTLSVDAVDEEPLSFRWFVDDEPQDADGPSFTYRPGFDDNGLHVVRVVVDDGTPDPHAAGNGTNTTLWYVRVANVNRPPIAAIASPLDGQTFTTRDVITFSAAGTVDPDGDRISYEWTSSLEGRIGIGETFDTILHAGTHRITLTVHDAHETGRGSDACNVTITVTEYVDPGENTSVVIDGNASDTGGGDDGPGFDGGAAIAGALLAFCTAAAVLARRRRG